MYANREIKTQHQLHVAGKDVTHKVRVRDYRVHRAAFAKDDSLTICLGSEANVYTTVPITILDLLEPARTYNVRVYNRATGWVNTGSRRGDELNELAVSIEDGGFRLIEMSGT